MLWVPLAASTRVWPHRHPPCNWTCGRGSSCSATYKGCSPCPPRAPPSPASSPGPWILFFFYKTLLLGYPSELSPSDLKVLAWVVGVWRGSPGSLLWRRKGCLVNLIFKNNVYFLLPDGWIISSISNLRNAHFSLFLFFVSMNLNYLRCVNSKLCDSGFW